MVEAPGIDGRRGVLHPGHRHDLGDLDPGARHHKMGMVLAENLRGCTMRLGLHDRIAADVVSARGPMWSTRLVFPSGAPPSRWRPCWHSSTSPTPPSPSSAAPGVALFIIFEIGPGGLVQNHEFFIGWSSSLSSLAMAMLRHPNPRRRPSQLHAGASGTAAAPATARWPVRHCRGWHPVQCAGGADAAL